MNYLNLPSIVIIIITIVGFVLFFYGISISISCYDIDNKDKDKIKECTDRSNKYLIIGGCLAVGGTLFLIITSYYLNMESEKKLKSFLEKSPSVNSVSSDSILSSDDTEFSYTNPGYLPR